MYAHAHKCIIQVVESYNITLGRERGKMLTLLGTKNKSQRSRLIRTPSPCLSAVTPRLTISPGQITARLGDSVTMRCQPTDSGPFQIEWQKVGGVLPPGVREFDGVLEIRQVTAADAGQYRCVATNNAGTSEGYATLNVAGEQLPWNL